MRLHSSGLLTASVAPPALVAAVVLTTNLFNQQTKYTTDGTLKTATATTRARGAIEAVSRPEE